MTSRRDSKQQEQTISEDAIFKVAKEVAIKFIEVGRVSPDSFPERFEQIYTSIRSTVKKDANK